MSPRDQRPNDWVALVASVPYVGHRLYEQRLARALSTHGPVVYLDPPAAPRSVRELLQPRLTVDDGRTVVQRARTIPFTRRLGLGQVRSGAARRAADRAVARRGGPPAAVVYTGSRAALDAFPGARRVLLVKDDYVAGAHLLGQDPARIEEELRRAVEAADAVVAVSPVLRDRLRRFDVEAEVIPAGCETVTSPLAPAPDGRAPRAVFLGGLSPRVLPQHLQAVLDAGCELVVLGELRRNFPEGPQLSALRAVLEHPRVQWRGTVGPDVVAEVMQTVDVGLVPYDASSFNAASFPLKILEYLAAGVPVVSTPLPALDWLGSDDVHVAEEAARFGEAAHEVGRSAATEVRTACRSFAAGHTWERRAEAWLELLGLAGAADRLGRAS